MTPDNSRHRSPSTALDSLRHSFPFVVNASRSHILSARKSATATSPKRIDSRRDVPPVSDSTASTLSHTVQRLEDAIRAVMDLIRCPSTAAEQLPRTTALFETLPMSTSEYAYVTSRLENAANYATDGEYGAARFELKMISKRLARGLQVVNRPRS